MQASPPPVLLRYFEENFARTDFQVRRRTALVQSDPYGQVLVCSVVQAFAGEEIPPPTGQPRRYPKATLLEDWLSAEECEAFVTCLHKGDVTIGNTTIIRAAPPQWNINIVSLANLYMLTPGIVVSCHLEFRGLQYPPDPMLSISQPYYPTAEEAARDWLGLTVYNGQSDSRNGSVVFLLPENRAFFTRAVSENGELTFEIGGYDSSKRDFVVKGAYWEHGALRHFECAVRDRIGKASIPDNPERLEYVLMDTNGDFYDSQKEEFGRHAGLEREIVSPIDLTLAEAVRQASLRGEGQTIEFKPFVDPQDKLGPVANRTKLGQVIQTIVAFSNSQGGRLYIGIDDSCMPAGIEAAIREWGKEAATESLLDRYRGSLINRIRTETSGDIPLTVKFAELGDHLVAVIEVGEAKFKPIEVKGDNYYYVRTGASNRKLRPSEWVNSAERLDP